MHLHTSRPAPCFFPLPAACCTHPAPPPAACCYRACSLPDQRGGPVVLLQGRSPACECAGHRGDGPHQGRRAGRAGWLAAAHPRRIRPVLRVGQQRPPPVRHLGPRREHSATVPRVCAPHASRRCLSLHAGPAADAVSRPSHRVGPSFSPVTREGSNPFPSTHTHVHAHAHAHTHAHAHSSHTQMPSHQFWAHMHSHQPSPIMLLLDQDVVA